MYLYVVCIYIYGAEVCMKCLQLTYTTHTDTHNTIERMTNDVRWQPGCRYKILLRHCPHCNTCATWWRWHMQINCVHNNMHNKFMYFVSVLFRFVSNTPMNLHSNARSASLYSVAVKMIYRGLTAHTSETPRARPPLPHNITHNRLVAIAYFTHSILDSRVCKRCALCTLYLTSKQMTNTVAVLDSHVNNACFVTASGHRFCSRLCSAALLTVYGVLLYHFLLQLLFINKTIDTFFLFLVGVGATQTYFYIISVLCWSIVENMMTRILISTPTMMSIQRKKKKQKNTRLW